MLLHRREQLTVTCRQGDVEKDILANKDFCTSAGKA